MRGSAGGTARLRAVFTTSGGLARLDAGDVSLIQYPATELEAGPAGVYLRIRAGGGCGDTAARYAVHPLVGPASGSRVAAGDGRLLATGRWRSLRYALTWDASETDTAWAWRVRVVNDSDQALPIDLVGTLDAALTPWAALRRSEYYVSQYLDCTPVETGRYGVALAVRQNMPGSCAPWVAFGSLGHGMRWSTDASQLARTDPAYPVDVGHPAGGDRWPGLRRDLPSVRVQHEHTLVAVQDRGVTLAPGEQWTGGFVGWYLPDHPAATGPDDAAAIESLVSQALPATPPEPEGAGRRATPTLFSPGLIAAGAPPTEKNLHAWIPGERRHVEREPGDPGEPARPPWAFQVDDDGEPVHVVTAAKELAVRRPHGHLLRSPAALTPAPDAAVTTCWMRGGFHSHVCQGHASIDTLVTLRRGYLSIVRASGIRVFVAPTDVDEGRWHLLEVPSAWAMQRDRCRWWYRLGDTTLLVTATAVPDRPEFGLTVETLTGPPYRLLLATETADGLDRPDPDRTPARAGSLRVGVASGEPLAERYPGGGIEVTWAADVPVAASGDEPLFADGESRGLRWLCLRTEAAAQIEFTLRPRLADPRPATEDTTLKVPTMHPADPATPVVARRSIAALGDALSWLREDALVHYLTPRGLEQYTGGAWGTRDVCQGPVGLLLATDRVADLRALMVAIFGSQQQDGSWAQWFDFQPAHRVPGTAPCHGDIPYWPLLALGDYLAASGDAGLLAQPVPYIGPDRFGGDEPLLAHVDRALTYLDARLTPDRRLPAYGHGDWNDALQPADPVLAAHLSSTWTATLAIHAFGALADALAALPDSPAGDLADRLRCAAARTREGLREVMLADGELAGYVLLDEVGTCVEHLVHPRDRRTGLHHGLLPAIHAVAYDLFSPAEAAAHLAMIRDHLHGPDGAHLFDRPARYVGGPMTVFQRAESAAFWGREVGLMYTHAHLRYVEALARVGAAGEAFTELMRVVPIGLTDRVAAAVPRQSTCYASSSDAAFADRYDAQARYADALAGRVPLEAGWRVYSSGPGLTLRLVTESLLGWRRRPDGFDLDPCLPSDLNGLRATVPTLGPNIEVHYRVGSAGTGVRRVTLDGAVLLTEPLDNPYRAPGVRLRDATLRDVDRPAPDGSAHTRPHDVRRVLVVELG